MNTMQTPVLLNTIRGDAMNKGRARVWLELSADKLAPFGFARGDRVEIARYSGHITITAMPQGDRKVAGRERNGRTICIFDICFDAAERARMFQGATRLQVWAWRGVIRITAPNVPANITDEV